MTVCVAIRVNDAMVFAADSAATLEARNPQGRAVVLNVYRHGNKIFNLYRGLPIVAMTSGMGNIGHRAIGSLAKDLRVRLTDGEAGWRINPDNYKIEEIAERARHFLFDEKFRAITPPAPKPHLFEFWVGGYSAHSDVHDLWKVSIHDGKCTSERLDTEGYCGMRWGGQPDPITRLIKGFAPNLLDDLVKGGLDRAGAEHIKKHYEVQLAPASMPVQDAIDLSEFLVETTKGYFRFRNGADIVGGETEIAVVTRHEGFKWVRRKHYYPAHLNVLETDHADQARTGRDSKERRDGDRAGDARVRISDARLRKPKRLPKHNRFSR
jgi:hypothetical protein